MPKAEITTPICDFLRDYAASGISRFHMPGHKGIDPQIPADGKTSLFYSHDITEISGADSLYEANGIIRESEENASRLFGTAATFYSTEGSSQCIRAMLALATDFGKNPVILAARNVHRAFITAAALLDLDVHWLMPEEGFYSLCSCPVTAEQIRSFLSGMDILPAAVYITSPDYLGSLADISSIADAVHAFGIPLLVDNAHGAYLHFLDTPLHPMDLGADMCCDSAHKTLPSLTGCAYLHLSHGFADRLQKAASNTLSAVTVRRALSLFGSTSPSYLLLESLDRTNMLLADEYPSMLADYVKSAEKCRESLICSGWNVLSEKNEPLKITIETSCSGLSGHALADLLRTQQIECEYADPDYLVLMLSPCNTAADHDRLLLAMKTVICSADQSREKGSAPSGLIAPPEQVLPIREAAFAGSVLIPVEKAAGRICTDLAVSCPPAIPIVVCGERIPEYALSLFRYYGINQISVMLSSDQEN